MIETKEIKVRRTEESTVIPLEFHIGTSASFQPPWVVIVYTTHLRKKKRLRPEIVGEVITGS